MDERAEVHGVGELLRAYLYVAAFDGYLRKIIGADKLASTRFNDVIKENLADRIATVSGFTVVEDGEEGGIKLVVEDRVARLPD